MLVKMDQSAQHNGNNLLIPTGVEQNGHAKEENGGSCSSSNSGDHQNGHSASGTLNKPNLDYLAQLLKDKKQLGAFPNVFSHVERLLDEEINRVRIAIFQCEFSREPLQLPEAVGEVAVRQEKVFVPIKQYPEYNFVGRILGPRGMTAKQLETETGCKIMVRGRGSMRDKKKEEMNRGKPNWEHLSEELHVIIQCEDTANRAELKIARAVEEVNKLLVPAPEGEDELKKKQLVELAIINGTFRNSSTGGATNAQQSAANPLGLLVSKSGAGTPLLQLDQKLFACSSAAAAGLAGSPLIMQSGTPSAAAFSLKQLSSASPSMVVSLQPHQQQSLLGSANCNSLAAAQTALALQQLSSSSAAATQQLFAASSPYGQMAATGQAVIAGAAGNAALEQYQQQLIALTQLQQQQSQQLAADPNVAALLQQQQLAMAMLQQQQHNGLSLGEYAQQTDPSGHSGGQRRYVGHSRESGHPYGGAAGSTGAK